MIELGSLVDKWLIQIIKLDLCNPRIVECSCFSFVYIIWATNRQQTIFINRHIIYAPSSHNKYAGESFPGIYDALFDIESKVDPSKAWEEVKRQISIAAFTVQAAAGTLREVA